MNKISVKGQVMYFYSQAENIPEGQVEFSLVEFVFSKEWEGYKKTAQFVQGDLIRNVILVEDKCFVPTEFKTGSVTVAIRGDKDGGSIGTANQLELEVVPSFAQGGTPPVPPPPDLYNKLLEELHRAEQAAKDSETKAAESASNARLSEDAAEQSEANAELSAKAARTSEGNAEVSANNAEASSVNADLAKKAAAGSASQASQSATEARQSAQEAAASAEGIETHEQNAGLYADAAKQSADKAAGHEEATRKISAGAANNAKSASESAAKAALENQNAQAAATAAKGSQNSAAQSATRAENAQGQVEQDAKAVAKNTETFGQYLKSATEVSQRIEANVQLNNQTATQINKDAAQVRSDKTEVEAAEKVVKTAEQNVVKLEAATQEAKTSTEGSASQAKDSATKAAQSEVNAKASEEGVQNSANAAAQSATESGNSATQASQSSTQAGTAAGKAETAQKAAEAAQGKATEEANRAKTEADRADSAVAEGLEAQKKYVNNAFAGAFVDHQEGEVIVSDMVSPVLHDVKCKVVSKNAVNLTGGSGKQVIAVARREMHTPITISFKCDKEFSGYVGVNYVDGSMGSSYVKKDGDRYKATFTGVGETKTVSQISVNSSSEITISELQVENGEKMTEFTPYIEDKSSVLVNREGANLLNPEISDPKKWEDSQYYLTEIDNKDAMVTISGVDPGVYLYIKESVDGGPFSNIKESGGYLFSQKTGRPSAITFETKSNKKYALWLFPVSSATKLKDIMLNLGGVKTFEKYTEPQSIKALSDGTVNGMTSASPTMYIKTNNPGVRIQADYNLDAKKYVDKKFAELQSAILSQGANI